MHSNMRIFIGFMVAPIILPSLFFLIDLASTGRWGLDWVAKASLLFGYMAATVLGIPAYFVMKRKNYLRAKHFLTSGMLIGFSVYALLFLPTVIIGFQYGSDHAIAVFKNTFIYSVFGVIAGALGSISFWLIAIRKNPHSPD